MENRTKLLSHTYKCSYTTVVDSLDDLFLNYGDAKAGAYELRFLRGFTFVEVPVNVGKHKFRMLQTF